MVKITEQLIRKKSEHNELIIGTLQELSLHQEDIEKIEHIHDWCRDLEILLLQSNLISRIENLNKLKKLKYLNLAMNNIETIENLDQLESLEKLDLTLNFIGQLSSVENLRTNYSLRELSLVGNYCAAYDGYRDYVIHVLPQLTLLDGVEVKRSDRLIAVNWFNKCREGIERQQIEQRKKRDEQKERVRRKAEEDAKECERLTEEEINERFWKKTSEHCPETRVEMAAQKEKCKPKEENQQKEQRKRSLFKPDGQAYCLNEPKLEFTLDDQPDRYVMNVKVYKFLDTSLIDVDVQPKYVRVTVKEKILQIALNDEVGTSESTTQRSMTTGHLLITMPKLKTNQQNEIVSLK